MPSGKSVGVDGDSFHASIHGSLSCSDCHTTIKEYPHPDKLATVKCETCHADQASAIGGSVHAKASAHPCTSCHGDAHAISRRDDPKSAVYPLNIPKTCGTCHANEALAKKYGLQNVYSTYMDSIHGYAVSKEGLLVAANCMSCHGSHGILSHKDPKSPTSQGEHSEHLRDVPRRREGRILRRRARQGGGERQHEGAGVHRLPHGACDSAADGGDVPHAVDADLRLVPQGPTGDVPGHVPLATGAAGRLCGDGALLGLPRGARGSAGVRSALAGEHRRTWSKTCSRCHTDANLSFVQYQPHANPHNRKLNPALYYVRLFMNLLLWGTLSFFTLHTLLWFIRAKKEQRKSGHAAEEKHD